MNFFFVYRSPQHRCAVCECGLCGKISQMTAALPERLAKWWSIFILSMRLRAIALAVARWWDGRNVCQSDQKHRKTSIWLSSRKTRTLTAIVAAVDAASNAFSCLFISHKLQDHTSSAYSTFVTASLRRIITIESILMNFFFLFPETSRFWLLCKPARVIKNCAHVHEIQSPLRGSWTFSGRWNCIS